MKRLCTILVSLILSVVIVYLGGGMVIVECLRANTVSVGVSDDDCCAMMSRGGDGGCQCMKKTVVKLSPTTLCKQVAKTQPPMFALALSYFFSGIDGSPLWLAQPEMHYVACVPHSPPRVYLAKIRVLII